MSPRIEPIKGYYLRTTIAGVDQRVYVEEAGQGIPLLCLHTAGSDGRQFRHMMNDPRITDHYRVVTFDLPWHGKSSPPAGWENTTYELDADGYAETILTILADLELVHPVLMGCSIGGRVVLQLARTDPEKFAAIIGLQSGVAVPPYYDRSYLGRPDVNESELCVALMSGLIGPAAPSVDRWETLWHYAQGGPGVFNGDLHFYADQRDVLEDVATIDTSRCPLYLLSGEYDYSCLPSDSAAVADRVEGAEFAVMKRVGHFPMSEDHETFYTYLGPVLDSIRRHSSGD